MSLSRRSAPREFLSEVEPERTARLALRQVARRIHSDVEADRPPRAASQPWATAERLLVCVGPSPHNGPRDSHRQADGHGTRMPLDRGVSRSGRRDAAGAAKAQIAEHFRLAERLGGETVTISGADVAGTILDYARSRNVTKIRLARPNDGAGDVCCLAPLWTTCWRTAAALIST